MGTLMLLATCAVIISATNAMKTVYLTNHCGDDHYITGDSQIRVKTSPSSSYAPNIDCKYTIITAGYHNQLMIQFNDLSIESSSSCSSDWLTMYDGRSSADGNIGKSKFCGSSTPSKIYTTFGHSLTLYFHSDRFGSGSGFDIIITPYRNGNCYVSSDIHCDNGRCVHDSMRCNGYNPCGDHSDCPLEAGAIAGIVVGSFFVIVIAVAIVFACRRRGALVRTRVAGATVTTVSSSTVQFGERPPSYSQLFSTGYNQPVPTQYSDTQQQSSGYATQAMTSYPPPAYQAPKY